MLAQFLAQLLQHLFAAAALFHHFQAAIDLIVQPNGFAKGYQIDAFDQHHHTDKDQDIDDRFCTQLHLQTSTWLGS